jgi:hypothetical protein
MKVSQGIHYWLEYHKIHSKKSTLKTYQSILSKLTIHFGERELNSLSKGENFRVKIVLQWQEKMQL